MAERFLAIARNDKTFNSSPVIVLAKILLGIGYYLTGSKMRRLIRESETGVMPRKCAM